MILALDPGKHSCGWALFLADGLLYEAGLLRAVDLDSLASAARSLGGRLVSPAADDLRVVVEEPQVYARSGWKGDPNDLVDLALGAGVVVGSVVSVAGGTVEAVRPSKWKGQTPKGVHNRRVLARLSPIELKDLERSILEEKVPPSLVHNVVDAVGLGLWALGRMRA